MSNNFLIGEKTSFCKVFKDGVVFNNINENNLNTNNNLNEKIKAIIKCYGEKPLKKQKEIKLSNGELITAWKIGDMNKEQLLEEYTFLEIQDIYDSGL